MSDALSKQQKNKINKNNPPAKQQKSKKDEELEEEESEEEESEEEEPVKKNTKKVDSTKSKKASKQSSSEEEEDDDDEEDEDEEESESEDEKQKQKKKPQPVKNNKKKESSEEEEESSEEDDDDEDEEEDDKKKNKNNAKPTSAPVKANNNTAAANTKKDKKAPAKGKEDLDDILAEFGDIQINQKNNKNKSSKEKENTSNSNNNNNTKDKDTNAPTQDLTGATNLENNKDSKDKEKDNGDDNSNAPTQLDEKGEKVLTKAQKERLKKKMKEEAKKAQAQDPNTNNNNNENTTAAGKPLDKKKVPGVEKLKAQLRQQKEEEEKRKAAELAKLAAEAEALRLEEEAAKQAEIARLKRIEDRKRARANKLILTPAEKEKQAKDLIFKKQLEEQGLVPSNDNDKSEKKEKVRYGNKVKNDKSKNNFVKKTQSQIEAERIRNEEAQRLKQAQEDISFNRSEKRKALVIELEKLKVAPPIEEEEEPDFFKVIEAEVNQNKNDQIEDDDVPDSWDAESDEDEKPKSNQAAQNLEIERQERIAKWKQEQKEKVAKATQERLDRIQELEKLIEDLDEEKRIHEENLKAAEEAERKKKLEIERAEEMASEANNSEKKKKKKPEGELRSPICCILGHVDTGKTKLLDKIRHTNVQDNEAGGITQQIGATYFPGETIKQQTAEICRINNKPLDMRAPGLLVIDTPGHESFTNLRSRGSGLCDIAILVIDLMVGLEKQTLESINLLKSRKTPFVIALNKVDRCYGWKAIPNNPFQTSLAQQPVDTRNQFESLASRAKLQLAQQGLNTELYYQNSDFRSYVSIIPTSAITGEGIPDLLMLLIQLTQQMMNEKLTYVSSLQCTVLEVKQVEGYGTTLDVVLVNGILNEGDTIVCCGLEGPIVTSIRALLTPPPNRELRIKADYVVNKFVKAAMGVKIAAAGLENAIPGSQLLVCGKGDDVEELKDEVQNDLQSILSRVDKSGRGVYVQSSTLGSLEALLSFLEDMKLPVSGISIGPVHKKDVMKASVMLEHQPEYALILAFDVKVNNDARTLAESTGVKIFTADIIYHLFDQAKNYMEGIKQKSREDAAGRAVFPVVLDIMPQFVFNIKAPIVLGCKVVDGILRIDTPLCIPSKEKLYIGRVTSIEKNHVEQTEAKKGEEVAVKIGAETLEHPVIYGRHFDHTNQIVSQLTRNSIDLLKANFKDDLTQADWNLVVKLKKIFEII